MFHASMYLSMHMARHFCTQREQTTTVKHIAGLMKNGIDHCMQRKASVGGIRVRVRVWGEHLFSIVQFCARTADTLLETLVGHFLE